MTRRELLTPDHDFLISSAVRLYGLKKETIESVQPHEGGRNSIFYAEMYQAIPVVLRISCPDTPDLEWYRAEVEYVRYLYNNGGNVANVISSLNGNLFEEILYHGTTYILCVFEKVKGKLLAENNYRYREGVPLSEYFCSCGKTLGRLHRLSKEYTPTHRRHSFFEKYSERYLDQIIPDEFPILREKLKILLNQLAVLDRGKAVYGMIHFDFNDGNYSIDFDTGKITVYDFDNSCMGHYLYDLADLWINGTGWIQAEPDAEKRKRFMESYFAAVLKGYRMETTVDEGMLAKLPLFINAVIMENIFDELESMRRNGEDPGEDEEFVYLVRCIEDQIPFKGFFSEIYLCESPFELVKD